MSRIKVGYKVVRYKHNQTVSAFMNRKWDLPDYTQVNYKISEWVLRPKNSGALCVFDTLENAVGFLDGCAVDLMIFKCEYRPSKMTAWSWGKTEAYQPEYKFYLDNPPTGTVFASSVKLIERVK